MDARTRMAPLELLRARRVVNAPPDLASAPVDPLGRLMRRRNEQIGDVLRRIRQADELRKPNGPAPTPCAEFEG